MVGMADHDLRLASAAGGTLARLRELPVSHLAQLLLASSAFFAAGAEQPPEAFT